MPNRTAGTAKGRVDALNDAPPVEADVVTADDIRGKDPHATAAAMVKANTNGDTTDPAPAFADLIKIVEHAETLRFEGELLIELYSLLDAARRQAADCKAVDHETVNKLMRRVGSWGMKRRIGEGGES